MTLTFHLSCSLWTLYCLMLSHLPCSLWTLYCLMVSHKIQIDYGRIFAAHLQAEIAAATALAGVKRERGVPAAVVRLQTCRYCGDRCSAQDLYFHSRGGCLASRGRGIDWFFALQHSRLCSVTNGAAQDAFHKRYCTTYNLTIYSIIKQLLLLCSQRNT